MTISATPDATFHPPRVQVDLAVPAGNIMSSLTVWRDGPGGRRVLRTQPAPGLDERTVFDFEAPFGVPVVYGWTVTYTGSTPGTVTELTSPVVLSPEDAWLIAPQSPGLSFPLGKEDATRAGFARNDSEFFVSNTTVHRILGARLPVTTTSGPRAGLETSLRIRTVTADERDTLRGLLATDFPILVNTPPAWGVGVPYGYFHVGPYTVSRVSTVGTFDERDFDLPLVQVRSPIADVENFGWDYSELATQFESYASLQDVFASYSDLAVNVRS